MLGVHGHRHLVLVLVVVLRRLHLRRGSERVASARLLHLVGVGVGVEVGVRVGARTAFALGLTLLALTCSKVRRPRSRSEG